MFGWRRQVFPQLAVLRLLAELLAPSQPISGSSEIDRFGVFNFFQFGVKRISPFGD
jgi:hypothetical protein